MGGGPAKGQDCLLLAAGISGWAGVTSKLQFVNQAHMQQ